MMTEVRCRSAAFSITPFGKPAFSSACRTVSSASSCNGSIEGTEFGGMP